MSRRTKMESEESGMRMRSLSTSTHPAAISAVVAAAGPHHSLSHHHRQSQCAPEGKKYPNSATSSLCSSSSPSSSLEIECGGHLVDCSADSDSVSSNFGIRVVNLKELREHGDSSEDEDILQGELGGDSPTTVCSCSEQASPLTPPTPSHPAYHVIAEENQTPPENNNCNKKSLLAASGSGGGGGGIGDRRSKHDQVVEVLEGASAAAAAADQLKNFESPSLGAEHSRDNSKSSYKCKCGKEFSSPAGLYIHLVKLTHAAKFACVACPKQYHFFSNLKRHSLSVHKTVFWSEHQVGCSRCGKTFTSQAERRGHRSSLSSTKDCCKKSNEVVRKKQGQVAVAHSSRRSIMITHSNSMEENMPGVNASRKDEDILKDVPSMPPLLPASTSSSSFALSASGANRTLQLKPPVLACYSLGQNRAQVVENAAATASRATINKEIQSSTSLNTRNGVCAAGLSSLSNPIFQFRTNGSPENPHSSLLHTAMREKQKLKTEYMNFKASTQVMLKERDEIIKTTQESAEEYRKAFLELKLQKEVFLAEQSHAMHDVQDDLQRLLMKISGMTQIPANDALCSTNNNNDNIGLAMKIRNLEERMASFESRSSEILAICKGTEENFKKFSLSTNEKLLRIIECLPGNNGLAHDRLADSIMDVGNDCDTVKLQRETQGNPGELAQLQLEMTLDSGMDSPPVLTPVPNLSVKENNCNDNIQSRIETRRQKRMKLQQETKYHPYKLSTSKRKVPQREDSKEYKQNNDDDGPPVLRLPSRLVKGSRGRSESMPILFPVKTLRQRNDRMAFNGVKRETSTGESAKIPKKVPLSNDDCQLHEKDTSKPGVYACTCGAKFTGAGGLYVHHVKSVESAKFGCEICGKVFHYFSGLKAHRKLTHKIELSEEVGCSRCGQVFKCKSERQGHLDERGKTCWLSGSYQNKGGKDIKKRVSSSLP